MEHQTPPLDYEPAPSAQRVRPRLWLVQMVAAAALCVAALVVDRVRGFGSYVADPTPGIEFALALYGLTCAAVSLKRGALLKRDMAAILICLPVFVVAFYVGGLMYRTLSY